MTETKPAMTFEDFRRVLADILLIGEDRLVPEAHFLNDLSVDSIRWLEMALTLERMGVVMNAETLWDIHTVGDAYQYYLANYNGLA